MMRILIRSLPLALLIASTSVGAQDVPVASVESQPLAANVQRLVKAFEFLGSPFPEETQTEIAKALKSEDSLVIQQALDGHVLFAVSINPELRVKVSRGPAKANIQQHGHTPVLIKVINDGASTARLNIHSPQAGNVFDGASVFSLKRQQQTELNQPSRPTETTRPFLDVEFFRQPPMTPNLSSLRVEYVIGLLGASEYGRREATVAFDIGQGTQDIGFRGELPILFDIAPAIPVRLSIRDADNTPTTARLTFRDQSGRIYPSQAKRLAPDFFFQPHIYRPNGSEVLLPPGEFVMTSSRGPEYVVQTKSVTIPKEGAASIDVRLQRWVNPMKFGFFCGDHHIHGAGCAHYQSPTQGVSPADMFQQVKGEGLNVGCVLTWGPCFDFQRRYFSPVADDVSEPMTRLKYDLEISGFGSAPLGHVCLLNLQDQLYPGTNGTTQGWPTWTVPVLRWCKEQGGVTGYPHSAMGTHPPSASQRIINRHDRNRDGFLSRQEAEAALLPEPFDSIDEERSGFLDMTELTHAVDRASDRLPNFVLPAMSGGGAMEIVVSVPAGVCDFISAMDTERIGEWNTWYHLLNCGFDLKLSGETDFPCMSSRRVGQGRVYVQLGDVDTVNFTDWCNGIAVGRSYVSDGYAHALRFSVNDATFGEIVELTSPATVTVKTSVAFAAEIPEGVAYGTQQPPQGRRVVGDTRELHAHRSDRRLTLEPRRVELIVNGQPVEHRDVPADGQLHDLSFDVPIEQSSWITIRQFPQLHTNPINVHVNGQPIRASHESARWCHDSVEWLWERRSQLIAEHERPAAMDAYEQAKATYLRIAEEARSRPRNR